MTMTDALPTDSVLRRHAQTERNRVLGLPPTDATLLRHYTQWENAQAARAGQPAAAAPAVAAKAAAPAKASAPATPAHAPTTAPASGGGVLGWLKRLLLG